MTAAPRDPKMGRAIKKLVEESAPAECVVYLDRAGTPTGTMVRQYNSSAELRRERTRRLEVGGLGAVVHMSVLLSGTVRITMVEILDEMPEDPGHPNVHAIASVFDGQSYKHRWIPIPVAAAERWAQTWQNGEEGASG